jgi:hypothetical protein
MVQTLNFHGISPVQIAEVLHGVILPSISNISPHPDEMLDAPDMIFFSFTTQLHDMFIHNMFIQPKTQHSSLCRRKKIPRCFPMSQASRSAVAKLARLAVRRAPSPALIAATSWPNGNFSSKPLDPSEASRRRSSREGVLGDGGMADDGCVLKEPTFLGDSLKNNGI